MFSIRIHHGGKFQRYPGRMYVNGHVDIFDMVDIDLFTVVALNMMVSSLLLQVNLSLCFIIILDHDTSLDEGLYTLACEEDVRCLATLFRIFKLIEVYIEHGVTTLDSYIRPSWFRETIEDITNKPGSIATIEHRSSKMLLLIWHNSSEPTKEPVCECVTPKSLLEHDSSIPCKDSVCELITPRFMPHCMLTPPTNESVITYTQLSSVQRVDTQDHVLPTIQSRFSDINLSFVSQQASPSQVIEVMRQLSFEETELDGEAGFGDVVGSGVESFGLSHDDSFGVDDLDLNLNERVDLNEPIVAEVRTQEPIVEEVRTQEPIVEDVIVEDYVSYREDYTEQGNGQEDESAPSDGQFLYDDERIDTAYESQYDVQSSEDAGTDDDNFLVDEENEIVEPDVDMHLFGISMDVPFDNICVTSLVPDDVLKGEDVDVINADGFDSGPGNDDEISNYRRKRLAELSREMEGVINASGQWKYSFYTKQKFTTAKEAKNRVYLHYIESRRNLKLYKNDSVRVRARCDRKVPVFTMSQGTGPTGPNRRMEAGPSGSSGPSSKSKKRKNKGTNDDSQACSSALDAHDKGDLYPWVLKIKHYTYKFLSEKIFDQVRVNPEIPIKAVQDQLQRDLKLQISMSKAFRAKAKAEREIRGDHVLQYSMLRDYVVELQSTNPNTTVKIVVERNVDQSLPTRVFQRIYVCLGESC
ncbi:hypothetical protein Tco_0150206 [Tanacetum coccineum]